MERETHILYAVVGSITNVPLGYITAWRVDNGTNRIRFSVDYSTKIKTSSADVEWVDSIMSKTQDQ